MVFSYKAVDPNGNIVTGAYNANEKSQVLSYIKAQSLTPISISNGKSPNKGLFMTKPKAKDLSMFCEQFCALLRAGVTALGSLQLLLEQTKNKILKDAIQTTISSINEGESLSRAMAKTPSAFDGTMTNLVKSGEESGSLDVALERLGSQYKKDAEIAATIKKAMVYPIIVLVVALAVVVFMLIWIVPKFMDIFKDLEIDMPKITMRVVAASEWIVGNWVIALLIVVGIVIACIAFARSQTGHRFFSKAALVLPGIKEFTTKSAASKVARTLSTLLSAGMTVVESLRILETTLPNYFHQIAIHEIADKVTEGQVMSKKFSEQPKLFPPMLPHMMAVGEDTGDMTSMLLRTADYYDLEVDTATQTMMSLLQPVVILLLAGIVVIVLAAVLAPMVSLYSQLGDAL